ncbi:MAG: helicase C-terminal domain-containing protein [Candidatus Krumholzibacteria bacterium]|nr:helicase C-terminal domain-containing protein [Candidatus Krumholzibacteria bacterium]
MAGDRDRISVDPPDRAGIFSAYIGERERRRWPGGPPQDLLLRRIAAGPVPAGLLARFAAEARFEGLSLIERAASEAAREAPLFGDPPGIETAASGDRPRRGGDPAAELVPGGPLDARELISLVESAFERIHAELGERRAGQLAVARTVALALCGDEIALIEAGTGTGKSLAYLVPSLIFAGATGERIVVSTHTIHLQEQLWLREYPVALRATGAGARAERLMGRENYLCSRRIVSAAVRLSQDDPSGALALALAAALSEDGTAASLPAGCRPERIRSVTAPPRCMMNGCPHAAGCALIAARRRAAEASVLFVNHALLLTDHRQGGGVIGPYRRVIIDEAHHLERSVMENLSVRIDRSGLERLLEQVTPVSPRSERWRYLVLQLGSAGREVDWEGAVSRLAAAAIDLESAWSALFDAAGAGSPCAGMMPGSRTRYREGGPPGWEPRLLLAFFEALTRAREAIGPLADAEGNASVQPLLSELRFIDEELSAAAETVRYLGEAGDPDSVYWIEWGSGGTPVSLCGSPLDVDRRFADYLDERVRSAVLTSATLAQRGSFDYLASSLGIALTGREPVVLVASSPFDLESGLLILRQQATGDPNDAAFAGAVAATVESLAREAGRSIMVLLTSYRMCRATGEALEALLPPFPVLMQGEGLSREAMAAVFRSRPGTVLLGVASFWEGVDFPGEELEILVIPKIPFPVPGEPVIEARSERLAREGENPFERLSLPEAVLKLRQGIGRLIRRRSDRGVVVLMDPRLGQRSYARSILDALPVRTRVAGSAQEVAEEARRWFAVPAPPGGGTQRERH